MWSELGELLGELEAEMESLCSGRPLDRAEGTRYLARLLASALSRFDGGPGPGIDYATPRIGGFNPDYLMGHAPIDPHGSYRLRGRMNGASRLALSTHAGALSSAQPIGHLSSEKFRGGADGRFEISVGDGLPHGP